MPYRASVLPPTPNLKSYKVLTSCIGPRSAANCPLPQWPENRRAVVSGPAQQCMCLQSDVKLRLDNADTP